MADATLAAIRTKVRRITRSPSEAQLPTTDIDEYINTFVLYDFPQQIKLDFLRTTLTFYTTPNEDTYASNSVVGDPLNDFDNTYVNVHAPVYVAGQGGVLSKSQTEFYRNYPLTNTIRIEAAGDGATVTFSGTLSTVPVLPRHVTFASINTAGTGIEVHDAGLGILSGDGAGTINYTTGAYTFTFTSAPGSSEDVNSLTIPIATGQPDMILFFNNKFIVRPVPDKVYPIQIEVDSKPTELLAAGQSPELEQWWQYIAYGASKKIFEDRMDLESVALIMPEFQNQERLMLRKTIVNLSDQRSATIYSTVTDGSGLYSDEGIY